MTPQEFCYWLQGFLEVSGAKEIKAEQLKSIKDHLALVFVKVTDKPESERAKELRGLIERLPRCSGPVRLC